MAGGAGRGSHPALGQLWFSLLAVLVGAFAGMGAVLFRGLIALIHNAMFLGKFSFFYDANVHTPASPWGFLVIAVPVVGGLGVVFLVKTFAPEAKGHGVPEVMDAIYYQGGKIRPVVAGIKAVASALSIGSGGSVGREGPIIQIGASFGSSVGQFLKLPPWKTIVLIGCGAGGGIAATFNTPVGGILFVVELMLHEVSARTLVPIAIATATATYVSRLLIGDYPSFVIKALEAPYFHATQPLVLVAYVGLGIITGLAAVLFIRSIYAGEDFFERRVPGGYYGQHLLGMLAIGLMTYGFYAALGYYYVEGVGYATVQDLLSNPGLALWLVLLLFGAKLLATTVTLGSGASGGIFSPALFLGATLGSAYGMILGKLFPGMGISPAAFAVAGMAGMVGGSTGAAVAAIVMIFEMTLDYRVIIPITIVVAISYGMRKWLCSESIYTMKLARRGHFLPDSLHTNPYLVKSAAQVMETQWGVLEAGAGRGEMTAAFAARPEIALYLVTEKQRVIGILTAGSELAALLGGEKTAGQLAIRGFVTVGERTKFRTMLARMRTAGAGIALVTSSAGEVKPEQVQGIITDQQIARAMRSATDIFRD